MSTDNSHTLSAQIQSIESNPNIQTVRCVTGQSDCTQTCVNSIHPNTKTSQLQKLFFTKRFFPLLYTTFNRNPIENDDCTFLQWWQYCAFFCKREIAKFNMTSLLSVYTSVIFLWPLCKAAYSGGTVNRECMRVVRGERNGRDNTRTVLLSYTSKKCTPRVRHKL